MAAAAAASSAEVAPIRELLGSQLLVKQDRKVVTSGLSVLDGKYIGIYFSAHWCPPCRSFTPRLRHTYEQLQAAKQPFEVVFVSSDTSQAQFEEYFAEMPWTAVPYSASSIRSSLSRHFGVSGIPTFVMLGPDGTVVSRNARDAVLRGPEGFPWQGATASGGALSLNNMMMLILLAWLLYHMFFK